MSGINQLQNQAASTRTPLEQVVAQLDNEINVLHDELDGLYARLQPYIATGPESNKPIQRDPRAIIGSSTVIVKMMELVGTIDLMKMTLRTVKERLEA